MANSGFHLDFEHLKKDLHGRIFCKGCRKLLSEDEIFLTDEWASFGICENCFKTACTPDMLSKIIKPE